MLWLDVDESDALIGVSQQDIGDVGSLRIV